RFTCTPFLRRCTSNSRAFISGECASSVSRFQQIVLPRRCRGKLGRDGLIDFLVRSNVNEQYSIWFHKRKDNSRVIINAEAPQTLQLPRKLTRSKAWIERVALENGDSIPKTLVEFLVPANLTFEGFSKLGGRDNLNHWRGSPLVRPNSKRFGVCL